MSRDLSLWLQTWDREGQLQQEYFTGLSISDESKPMIRVEAEKVLLLYQDELYVYSYQDSTVDVTPLPLDYRLFQEEGQFLTIGSDGYISLATTQAIFFLTPDGSYMSELSTTALQESIGNNSSATPCHEQMMGIAAFEDELVVLLQDGCNRPYQVKVVSLQVGIETMP